MDVLISSWSFCEFIVAKSAQDVFSSTQPLLSLPFLFPCLYHLQDISKCICGNHNFFSQSFCLIAAVLEWPGIMVLCCCLAVEVLQFFNFTTKTCHLFMKNSDIVHPSQLQFNKNRGCVLRVSFCSISYIPSLQGFTFLELFSVFSDTGSDPRILLSIAVMMLSR